MKEHPIIFSSPMIRAILEDRKTQTRRIILPQPTKTINDWSWDAEPVPAVIYRRWPHRLIESRGRQKRSAGELTPAKIRCRYGVPGDRCWVKESFLYRNNNRESVVYRADLDSEVAGMGAMYGGWKPSIHMPRSASRITVEITEVRVQRLQEISEGDAIAEGITCTHDVDGSAQDHFAELWDSINAKRMPWASNPWVWAIAFRWIT